MNEQEIQVIKSNNILIENLRVLSEKEGELSEYISEDDGCESEDEACIESYYTIQADDIPFISKGIENEVSNDILSKLIGLEITAEWIQNDYGEGDIVKVKSIELNKYLDDNYEKCELICKLK